MTKLKWILRNFPIVIAAVALCCAVTIMVVNVLTRYFLSFTFTGYEEIIVICFSYTVFFGGAAAFLRGEHYGVDAIVNKFPQKLRLIISMLVRVVMIGTSSYLALLAWQLADNAWTKLMAATRIPYFYFDIPACACFALIAVYSFGFLVEDIKAFAGKETAGKEEPEE